MGPGQRSTFSVRIRGFPRCLVSQRVGESFPARIRIQAVFKELDDYTSTNNTLYNQKMLGSVRSGMLSI